MKKKSINANLFNFISILTTILIIFIAIFGYINGYFTSIEALQNLILSAGALAPIVFMLAQILQVVFPIIPGGLGCVAGVVLFGPYLGFIYNYISILIGSLIVFSISKKHGRNIVNKIFSKKTSEKYFKWVDNGDKFKKLFAFAIFFPAAPDDLLCYIAGTTKMKWSEYTLILILGKPLSIAAYSLSLTAIFDYIFKLL